MTNDPKTGRNTPPDDDEWDGIWSAIDKAHKGWIVVGPVWAVVSNWKALGAVLGVVVWFNRGGVVEILQALAGLTQ